MNKINLFLAVGILQIFCTKNIFSQNLNNKSAADFGMSIFYSVKENNVSELFRYLPVSGDTVSYIGDNNIEQEIVITTKMIKEVKEILLYSFRQIEDELMKEKKKQNIDHSQIILHQITTEYEVIRNQIRKTTEIEIYLKIQVGSTQYILRIEDNIKTKNGYFLFDNLKIKSKEENVF